MEKVCTGRRPLKPIFPLLKALEGDEAGNLIFKGTARTFNPAMWWGQPRLLFA